MDCQIEYLTDNRKPAITLQYLLSRLARHDLEVVKALIKCHWLEGPDLAEIVLGIPYGRFRKRCNRVYGKLLVDNRTQLYAEYHHFFDED